MRFVLMVALIVCCWTTGLAFSATGNVLMLSSLNIEGIADRTNNRLFDEFVGSVSNILSDKVIESGVHGTSSETNPTLEQIFKYNPLIVSKNTPTSSMPAMVPLTDEFSCHLDTPWVQLSITRPPNVHVQAVFIWNERQFLIDQYLLAGGKLLPAGQSNSVEASVFDEFVRDYTDTILLAPTPEAKSVAQNSISERLPPEILWLFRQAWQSTRGPFFGQVDAALHTTVEQAAAGYLEITKGLIERCSTSQKMNERYESILELAEILPLERYKIRQP